MTSKGDIFYSCVTVSHHVKLKTLNNLCKNTMSILKLEIDNSEIHQNTLFKVKDNMLGLYNCTTIKADNKTTERFFSDTCSDCIKHFK